MNGWAFRGAILVAVAGIQTCWLHAVLCFLSSLPVGGGLRIAPLLLAYPASLGLRKAADGARGGRIRGLALHWLGWPLAALILLKFQVAPHAKLWDPGWLLALWTTLSHSVRSPGVELLVIAGSGLLWWLGGRLARVRLDHARVLAEFQFGVFLLLILFWVDAQMGSQLRDAVPLVVSFFLVSLLAVALGHARERWGNTAAGTRPPWVGSLLVSVFLFLGLGWLLVSLLTPDLLNAVWSQMERMGRWILERILEFLAFLARVLPKVEPAPLPASPPPMAHQARPEWADWLTIPEPLRALGRFLVAMMWLFLILLALWGIAAQAFRWLARQWGEMGDVELEPVDRGAGWGLGALLRRALQWVMRLRAGSRRPGEPLVPPASSAVRRMYRGFLRWAADGGHPRDHSQTPQEFLAMLGPLVPEARFDLTFITEQYVKARYGAMTPDSHELEQLREAWSRVRRMRLQPPPEKEEENGSRGGRV